MVALDTDDDLDPFFCSQEPSIGRGVGEEVPEGYRGYEGQDAGDRDQPLPGLEVWGVNVRAAEREQAQEDDGKTVHQNWKWALEWFQGNLVKIATYTNTRFSASAQYVYRTWR